MDGWMDGWMHDGAERQMRAKGEEREKQEGRGGGRDKEGNADKEETNQSNMGGMALDWDRRGEGRRAGDCGLSSAMGEGGRGTRRGRTCHRR